MLDWPKQRTFSIRAHSSTASSPGRCGIARLSVLIVLYREGRIETFKYRGAELICEASGPDFETAMIHTSSGGIAIDEPWASKIGSFGLGD